MSVTTFDKLLYLETLKAAGVSEEQARAHAHALDEALRDSVATKNDLARECAAIKADLREMELRLTIKLGGMLAAGIAIVAALVKLIH